MKIRVFILLYLSASILSLGCYYKQKSENDQSALLYLLAFESFAKADAAVKTATNNCNCTRIIPYYWEIGDANGKIVSGSFPGTLISYDESTNMLIASASKLIWGAYVLEKKGTAPGADEDNYLRMLSGYTNMADNCNSGDTVNSCFAKTNTNPSPNNHNNDLITADENNFFYNSGHFQAYAVNVLGFHDAEDKTCTDLANEVMSYLGTDLGLSYTSPVPAGGGKTNPASYRSFLIKIMKNQLKISQYLGFNSVCAQFGETDCGTYGVHSTPLPAPPAPPAKAINWRYSYAHWVEDDDAILGDGSYSSPGLFGFYPWINHDKTLYGIVARVDLSQQAYVQSVYCGKLIRKAFIEGREQTNGCY